MGLTQITTGGVDDNINIDSNTLKVDGTNNRVGIGTSSPGFKLEVNSGTSDSVALFESSDTTARIILRDNGSTSGGYVGVATEDMFFHTNGTERLRIDSSGRVGIGTSSPGAKLSIEEKTYVGAGFIRFLDNASSQTGTAMWRPATDTLAFNTNSTERLRINSSGKVGIATTSPTFPLQVETSATGTTSGSNGVILVQSKASGRDAHIRFGDNVNATARVGYLSNSLYAWVNGAERLRIDSSGRVGIGTTSPGVVGVHVRNSSEVFLRLDHSGTNTWDISNDSNLKFARGGTERMRIDSSGRLLVGLSSNSMGCNVESGTTGGNNFAAGRFVTNNGGPDIVLRKSRNATVGNHTIVQNGDDLGNIFWGGSNGSAFKNAARITAQVDGTPGTGDDMPGRLMFYTSADGSSIPTERMRINRNGVLFIGQFATTVPGFGNTTAGHAFRSGGDAFHSVSGAASGYFNRSTDDGVIVYFMQAGSAEGSISVSGTTVSYNGGHLARWSQLAGGVQRTEILRGTVLSNLDEMCEWGEENNEQLNRMQVSDVEGDKNVSGVFQAWDDDDDTYTNDFYCAMTGDFVIRVAQGTTVARGDLLMSAGDGTAKPQDDDIVRSKTIAKVTSTTVSTTYSDGSYCVPCVLMAC